MVYFVGGWWMLGFSLTGVAFLAISLYWGVRAVDRGRRPYGSVVMFILAFACAYMGIFAGTHFRVKINTRALLIDTINQRVIGIRESGVQSRPLIGVKPISWPANTDYKIFIDLKPGTESAVSKNSAPLFVDTTFYLDLSEMDIEAAYLAFNGDWDKFMEAYVTPQFANLNRVVSQRYDTKEHETRRDEWEDEYEAETLGFLEKPGEGYNIRFIENRTVMAWDFVNSEDAKEYDEANRAVYLAMKRENEMAALKIEAQMTAIRASMIVTTTTGTTESLRELASFLADQPAELRPYLMSYIPRQVDLEYLRLVGQQQPELIFPPGSGSGPVVTYDVSKPMPLEPAPVLGPEVPPAIVDDTG